MRRGWINVMLLLSALSGCAPSTLNHARLIGSHALDIPGNYPRDVVFDRGTFSADGAIGSAVLVGPRAVLLFDYNGYANRFELMFYKDSQTVLYRRLGERGVMSGDGRLIRTPVGIHVEPEQRGLHGTFDVVVARADLRGFGPAFEHYPKQMRVVGRFAIGPDNASVGPTDSAKAFWRTPDQKTTPITLRGLDDVDDQWLITTFAQTVPRLGLAE